MKEINKWNYTKIKNITEKYNNVKSKYLDKEVSIKYSYQKFVTADMCILNNTSTQKQTLAHQEVPADTAQRRNPFPDWT